MKADQAKLEAAGFTRVDIQPDKLIATPPGGWAPMALAHIDADGELDLVPKQSVIHRKIRDALA